MNYHLFHLSHTDLDGYGCQMVTQHYFDNANFYNSNYGKEIDERFHQILLDMETIGAKKNIILITDLNLTVEQCHYFEKELQNASQEAKLLLLDHHKSGQDCFEEYPWYYLDTERCATKITYDFFASIYGADTEMATLVNVINAVDIWLSDDPYFELGKVCLGLVANAKEINRIMFEKANNDYIFNLLKQVQPYLDQENPHIVLDEAIHGLKKNYFRGDKADDTLSNLISAKMVELLGRYKNKMSIEYQGYKGIVSFNIGNVSVIGNDFLVANPNYDFFMDVTSRKTVSFRSNGKVDVSKIAKKLAGGGGHPNASGGVLNNFKDSFLYDKIIAQVKHLIKQNEE